MLAAGFLHTKKHRLRVALVGVALALGCAPATRQPVRPVFTLRHDISTESPVARIRYTDAYRLAGDLEHEIALGQLREAIEADPEFAMAWRMLAVTLWAVADSSGGDEAMARALALSSGASATERLHIDASDAYRRQEYRAALSAYDQIVALDSMDLMAHTGRGLLLRTMGRNDEALRAYGNAIRLDPASRIAYTNRAVALARMGRYEESLEDLKLGSFGPVIDAYLRQRNPKALAFARDGEGRWTWWRWGARTRTESIARAVLTCADRARERGVESACSLYAIDDDIVWGNEPPERAPRELSGTYRLEIDAVVTCTGLPLPARRRTYGAVLEQSGPSFTVVLSGRRFADDPAAGLQNRFTGVVFGDQVVLDIRDPLVEVVTDQNYLFFDGLGVGTIGRQTIRGVLAGTVLWGGYPSESCSHEGHEFTLTRVTSSGRVR